MDAGPLVVQGAQGLRQDPGVHGIADVSHAQSAFLAAPQAAAEVLEPVRVPQQGRGLGEEDAAVGGEAQALLAALEQGQAQVLLQLGDLLTSGDWEMCRRSAARPTCSSSATATK